MVGVLIPAQEARDRFQDQATLAHACAALTLHPGLNLNSSLSRNTVERLHRPRLPVSNLVAALEAARQGGFRNDTR